MASSDSKSMSEVLTMQKDEANTAFCNFIEDNYEDWIHDPKAKKPLMSNVLMRTKVFPLIKADAPLYFILIDNLRYDQWKMIQGMIEQLFTIEEESTYYSILPTTTAYARNSIFSGLMPKEIAKQYPQYWVEDSDDEGKNNFEEQLLAAQIQRNRLSIKSSYNKITNHAAGTDLLDKMHILKQNQLNVIVYNFVDMLSHARTDAEMIRELAPDEAAYRSITQSWFEHSPLYDMIKIIAEQKGRIVITTDHGTIRVRRPFKIVGDKNVNTNLRYKQGKNLGFDSEKDIMVIRKPENIMLPAPNVSTAYVFARNDFFFAYPNNYNHYVNYFKNTFQHGGISMEEMIIPFIVLNPK